jgi:MFS family permease
MKRGEGALPNTATSESEIHVSAGAGRRVFTAAYFGLMVNFGSLLVFSFSTFLNPLGAAFGWSRESVSASFGFAALTVAVCSPALGRLLDRHPPRRIIVPCMALFGLSYASLGFLKPRLVHLYAVFILMGRVGNLRQGYSHAVSTWFAPRRGDVDCDGWIGHRRHHAASGTH